VQNKEMADFVETYIADHIKLAERITAELRTDILRVSELLCQTFSKGGKLLTFGNGGSAADAAHLAEEMIGRFLRDRRPLPAVSLVSDCTALTCIGNDFGFTEVFARQVTALANPGDLVVGFSTSGNSENVLRGLKAAREKGAITVAMLGRDGGKIAAVAEYPIIVRHPVTSLVQEMHILIVHLLCDIVDRWAAGTA
jgi:D-sedoheptulose 7-phosphate isomerase